MNVPPINVVTSGFVSAGLLLVFIAYFPLIKRSMGPILFHMMRAAMAVAAISVLRSGYWDWVQYFAGDSWSDIRNAMGGQRVSLVFNIAMFFPVRDFLKARLHMIDRKERHLWRWWNAWLHPNGCHHLRRRVRKQLSRGSK